MLENPLCEDCSLRVACLPAGQDVCLLEEIAHAIISYFCVGDIKNYLEEFGQPTSSPVRQYVVETFEYVIIGFGENLIDILKGQVNNYLNARE